MRNVAPALSPLFRSQLQGHVLATTFARPEHEWSISDLAAHLHAPVTSVHDEVSRLVRAEILRDRRHGRSRLVCANRRYRSYDALADLVITTFGAPHVIAREFDHLNAGIVIFGSWAARYLGRPGPPPRDLDVLLIGAVDRPDSYAAAQRCEIVLRIDVNPLIRPVSAWVDPPSDPLVDQVVRRPFVMVKEVPSP